MYRGRSGSVVVLAGALALTAFTAPSAEATPTGVKVSALVVNNGKAIVVGTSAEATPKVTFHLTWPAGPKLADVDADPFLYHGTTAAKGSKEGGIYLLNAYCAPDGSHAADCDGLLSVDPRHTLDSNSDATGWKIAVVTRVWGSGGRLQGEQILTGLGSVHVKRAARVAVNALPEQVAKGGRLTVTGTVTRADWVRHEYTGFAGKSAQLQFRKAGTATYTTVKTVRTNSAGALKTTTTASGDGYWRWAVKASATTGGAASAPDYVDVR